MGEPIKEYLGDSVYVQVEDGSSTVTITTENGLPTDPSNTIHLDPGVMNALIEFIGKYLIQ